MNDYMPRRHRPMWLSSENAALLIIASSLLVIGYHLRLRSRIEWIMQTSAAAAPIGYLTPLVPALPNAQSTVFVLGGTGASCAAFLRGHAPAALSMPMVLVSTVNPPQFCSPQPIQISPTDARKVARMLADSGATLAIVDAYGRAIYSTRGAEPTPGVAELLASVH